MATAAGLAKPASAITSKRDARTTANLCNPKRNYIGSMLMSMEAQTDNVIPTKFCPRGEKPRSYQA
jgi:hypothetical protein